MYKTIPYCALQYCTRLYHNVIYKTLLYKDEQECDVQDCTRLWCTRLTIVPPGVPDLHPGSLNTPASSAQHLEYREAINKYIEWKSHGHLITRVGRPTAYLQPIQY